MVGKMLGMGFRGSRFASMMVCKQYLYDRVWARLKQLD